MNLRAKILFILILALSLFLSVLYFITNNKLSAGFRNIENINTVDNVRRLEDAFDNQVSQLLIKQSDWSSWDDTYQFIQDYNQEYIDSNLNDTSFILLHINFMLFVNSSGKLVYEKYIDLETNNHVSMPQEVHNLINPMMGLAEHKSLDSKIGGLLALAGKPYVIVSRPILNSAISGPIKGALIWGYQLNDSNLEAISKLNHTEFSFKILTAQDNLIAQELKPDTPPSQGKPVVTKALSEDEIAGYSLINDLYGHPAFLLQVNRPRMIHKQGQLAIRSFGISMILATVLFGILLFILLEKLVRSMKKLEDVNQELAKLSQLKSEFTAMVSHEIRTPFTAIKEGINMLLEGVDGPISEPQRETLHVVHNSIERLSRLINNVLDLSKLEAGKTQCFFEKANFNAIVMDVCHLMQPSYRKKHLHFTMDVPERLLWGVCDIDKMKQVLVNLIDNAIKFNKEGGKLGVKLYKDGDFASIDISDSGIGIKNSDQKSIFRMFEQVRSKGQWKSGTGLGLTICQSIVDQHLGSIVLKSVYGEGSIFTVKIPLNLQES